MTLPAETNLPSTEAILAILARGGVVMTATQRLARQLTQQVANEGATVIEKPAILSLEAWLIDTWSRIEERNSNPRRLLSSAETSELWRRVIEDHAVTAQSFSLLRSDAAAELAARCRTALKTYSVSVAHEANRRHFESEIDTQNFLSWLDSLDAKLRREGWLLLEDTYEIIAQQAPKNAGEVLFLSEEAPGPALSAVLKRCFSCATWHHSQPLLETLQTHVFDTRPDELAAAAQWGKAQYDKGLSAVIVLADYHRDRAELEQFLRHEFEVEGQSFTQLPVNFSRGVELAKTPMYRDLLLLLRLVTRSLSREDVLALIRSPFFRWNRLADKATVIRGLFSTEERQFSLQQVLAQLTQVAPQSGLAEGLNWARVERLNTARNTVDEWREVLIILTTRAGWPGAAGLDSVEYQQYELFSDLLDEIEVNPLDNGAVALFRFLEKLNYSLAQRIFQPQTDASPLQVMFLRDTFGLSFQACRVVGAVTESLPPAPQALSLIPWQICHDYNIRSVFESEPEVIARRLLGRLNERAPTLLSFTRMIDGLEALPSRFCAAPTPMPQMQSPLNRASRGTLEEILDDRGFEVATPVAQTGGVGLLEDQALCPLKAHLKHRLDISSLREAQTGLSAAERGALLHSALFYTFDELSNSEKLLSIALSEQAAVVSRAVDRAITNIRSSTRDRVGLNVIDLERKRLQTSVANWVEIERKREIPFEVIERETSYEWQSQGLTLSFKVDRVDELSDGGRLVIDYKSKATNTLRDWTDNPIKAPQLPCYSEVIDDVVAVAIASVTDEKAGYRPLGTEIGVGRSDQSSRRELEEKANLSWAQLREQWRIDLDRLVADFIAGDARATPSARACRYCDFASICRAKISALVEDGAGDIEGAPGD